MTVLVSHRRALWMGGIFVLLVGLLVLTAAPAANRLNSGSTWNRAPDGYGAWYAHMMQQNAPIQRWQRSTADLLSTVAEPAPANPATLIRVYPRAIESNWVLLGDPDVQAWLKAGHRIIALGLQMPVTAAPFSSEHPSAQGTVTIQTRRRLALADQEPQTRSLLADDFGTIVWQPDQESGELILATTPFLAANAYQGYPGNFAFLAALAIAQGGPIWVDEYLHGYKDRDVVTAELGGAGSWVTYLAKTPWLVVLVQVGLVIVVGLIAHNRRPGIKQTVNSPVVDNSEAYIQALAGVLHKAASHDFVVDTLAQEERLMLQKALGLGAVPVPDGALAVAWVQMSEQPSSLLTVLTSPAEIHREQDLRAWLGRLHRLHQTLHVRKSVHE